MAEFTDIQIRHDVDGVSRRLAPEEIRAGMYVAVLRERSRVWPWFVTVDDIALGRVVPFEFEDVPVRGGTAVRVVEVCLPYVLVVTAKGKAQTFDVRRVTLTQMSERYGRELFRMTGEKKGGDRSSSRDSG